MILILRLFNYKLQCAVSYNDAYSQLKFVRCGFEDCVNNLDTSIVLWMSMFFLESLFLCSFILHLLNGNNSTYLHCIGIMKINIL